MMVWFYLQLVRKLEMLKRKWGLNEKAAAEVVDRLGNNIAIRCFGCGGVLIVGSPPIYRKERACPHCHQTAALKNAFDDGVTIWINEDGRSNRPRGA
jgi:hypothetical protein